jgi:hypothetical protein
VKKQLIPSDFNTEEDTTYTWFINYNPKAVITMTSDGSLVFTGEKHTVIIKNIGSNNETVIIPKQEYEVFK